ncbi:carbonic anhydrase [Alienimonas chondri]|uniref:Carbonic anhydrase n=1 Tax=Alienimonas chondri TaxID=2681879 RepID=A0ABX1VI05_9PLAN|nr:carbonic anhydrase [Alienimonas chondri]NNJ27439.1 Carbonic anhydrase 1 [Alienimonas chondri]
MSRLADGVRHFRSAEYPKRSDLFQSLAGGQSPNALFICCSDSRVNPTLLTNSDPGDLFVVENAGNIVPAPGSPGGGGSQGTGGEAATLEYAVRALKVPEIIVCGHAKCGAMGGLMAPDSLGSLPLVADWLKHSASVRETVNAEHPNASQEEKVDAAIKANVRLQLENLKTYDCVREAMDAGTLTLSGWVYDFVSGEVIRWDDDQQNWVEVA